MSALRLFSPAQLCANAELTPGSEQARYVGRLLRLRPDEALTVFDGSGGEYAARIDTVTKQDLRLPVDEHYSRNTDSPLRIRLVQGVSRSERMDIVVQKGTETAAIASLQSLFGDLGSNTHP